MLTGVDWAVLSRLVPEIVLVLVFMWYTRERDKASVDAQRERDEEWRTFLSEERKVRQDMLHDERQARGENTTQVVSEIKSLSALVQASNATAASTNALVVQHDTWARMEASRSHGGKPN
jgi:hypothetical protein